MLGKITARFGLEQGHHVSDFHKELILRLLDGRKPALIAFISQVLNPSLSRRISAKAKNFMRGRSGETTPQWFHQTAKQRGSSRFVFHAANVACLPRKEKRIFRRLRASYFAALSHFVRFTLSLGCETNRCHTTA